MSSNTATYHKIGLGLMIILMVTGVFFLLVKETGRYSGPTIYSIQDSVKATTTFQSIGIDGFLEIYQLKRQLERLSLKDSLTSTDSVALRTIDTQLNRMIHEKN